MKDTINIAINKIIGQSLHYNGSDYYFERFKEISTGKICIYTHRGILHFEEHEIEGFLASLTEPKSKDFRDKDIVSINTRNLQGYTPSAENIELKATLMEMLTKVKNNPAAIPQAREVCAIANAMVNIQKTELEMLKMIGGKKQ